MEFMIFCFSLIFPWHGTPRQAGGDDQTRWWNGGQYSSYQLMSALRRKGIIELIWILNDRDHEPCLVTRKCASVINWTSQINSSVRISSKSLEDDYQSLFDFVQVQLNETMGSSTPIPADVCQLWGLIRNRSSSEVIKEIGWYVSFQFTRFLGN